MEPPSTPWNVVVSSEQRGAQSCGGVSRGQMGDDGSQAQPCAVWLLYLTTTLGRPLPGLVCPTYTPSLSLAPFFSFSKAQDYERMT